MSRLVTDHLPLLAGAPNGVKKLRELILELAVRGALVRQDPEDRPVEDLLGIYKIESNSSHLPGWRTVQLGKIGKIIGGATPSKSNPEFWSGEIPWVSPKDMKRPVISDAEDHISECALNGSSLKFIPTGSILMVVRGMILAHSFPVAMTTRPTTINQDMKALAVPEALKDYLLLFLQASKSRLVALVDRSSHGTCKLVSDKLWQFNVDFPPLAEQHRIIAKVDELMALCDRLETRQSDAQAAHARLVDELLGSLLQARDAEDFQAAWERLAGQIHTVFTTVDSINLLQQKVLQLALEGKFSPRTQNESSKTSGKDGISGTLPSGWTLKRLGDLVEIKHGYAFSSEFFDEESGAYILTTPGNFNESGGFRDRGSRTKYYSGPIPNGFTLCGGELIVAMTEQAAGLLGSAAFIPEDGKHYLHNQRLGKLIFNNNIISPDYLYIFFNGPAFRQFVASTATGMKVKHTSPEKIGRAAFPLPPLTEQRRIVAKVTELLALCDRLKERIRQARQVQERLAGTLVERAVS